MYASITYGNIIKYSRPKYSRTLAVPQSNGISDILTSAFMIPVSPGSQISNNSNAGHPAIYKNSFW